MNECKRLSITLQSLIMWVIVACLGLLGVGEADAACNPKVRPANFDDFKACTYREPDTGIWIVDGDVPVIGEEALRRFYEQMLHDADAPPRAAAIGRPTVELIVNRVNNSDDTWPVANRCGIRYCVSRASTTTRYQQVVDAMASASQAWSANAGVRFLHATDQDNNCTANNGAVEFDVQVVSGQPYLARSFFPAQTRATRNVLIDTTSFSTTPPLTLEGVLRHELGHTLGFRHEHTRPEAGGVCFEDSNWRVLTPYDSNSVMHYPQCNGTAGWGLTLTPQDVAGSVSLYGNTTGCGSGSAGAVACSVFNDGYANLSQVAEAVYFRANGSVCTPDGTASGTCRKWFGRCQAVATGERVNFTVFNDGYNAKTPPSDAVYFRAPNSACVPDGTATGKCRRWTGQPISAGGRAAECFLFNDGYTNVVGPTDAIYARGANQVCMPDGSASGTCRRWFGRCRLK